jgi:hypothetical protein
MPQTLGTLHRPFESDAQRRINLALNLNYPYQPQPKPKPEPLFTPEDSVEDLIEIRDFLLDELCELENLRHPSEKDNLNKTLTLRKIQVLEAELMRRSMEDLVETQTSFIAAVKKLMGL